MTTPPVQTLGVCAANVCTAGFGHVGQACVVAADCNDTTNHNTQPPQVNINLPPTPGGGCPPVGHPRRILDRVGGGGLICP
jgi:hypothetical protein